MDFQLSDEQALLRDTTRDVLARSYDPERRNKVVNTELGWSREVWSQLAEIGILGLGFDPGEAGQLEIMLLVEVGRRLAPEPVIHAALGPGAIIAELAPLSTGSCSMMWRPARSCSPSHTSSFVAVLRRQLCGKEIRGR